MPVFKIYVSTKKKDGTITKSDNILVTADDKDAAIQSAIKEAKGYYGFKGKVHIGSCWIKTSVRPKIYSLI